MLAARQTPSAGGTGRHAAGWATDSITGTSMFVSRRVRRSSVKDHRDDVRAP